MTKIIDYYFSLNSPWTYLGGPRLAGMAERHGAQVRVKPVSLGDIFPKTGGLPLPKRAPARQAYRLVELERWREFLSIEDQQLALNHDGIREYLAEISVRLDDVNGLIGLDGQSVAWGSAAEEPDECRRSLGLS